MILLALIVGALAFALGVNIGCRHGWNERSRLAASVIRELRDEIAYLRKHSDN